jgi:hypothetical protein
VKIVNEVRLKGCGEYSKSRDWQNTRATIHKAIAGVDWPPGAGRFTIFPESGKKRGQGNGVKPIKVGLMVELRRQGWIIEGAAKNAAGKVLGDFDAVLLTRHGPVVVEWETGNVSSSHRSLNKMTMLLAKRIIAAGILVVPSRSMAAYLTDRIGNAEELEGYFEFWRSHPCEAGILEVVVIEHDAVSRTVPRIPKGTDGRAER